MEDNKDNKATISTNIDSSQWIKVEPENISSITVAGTTYTTEAPKENPVDKSIDELEKQMGIKLNREKVLEVSREALLDFVESNNEYKDLTEEQVQQMVDNILGSVEVPEVIEKQDEINQELGLTPEDLKQLYGYLSGKVSQKPAFLDRYLAGSTNKLIDFQHVMTLIRLSQIPQLAAMNASIQKRLYSPENLLAMGVDDLTKASANISREMSDILNNAVKSIEIMNTLGRVDSRYQAMIDKLLVVPDDVLNQIEHLLNNYQ